MKWRLAHISCILSAAVALVAGIPPCACASACAPAPTAPTFDALGGVFAVIAAVAVVALVALGYSLHRRNKGDK